MVKIRSIMVMSSINHEGKDWNHDGIDNGLIIMVKMGSIIMVSVAMLYRIVMLRRVV